MRIFQKYWLASTAINLLLLLNFGHFFRGYTFRPAGAMHWGRIAFL